jgi:cell division transport system permease protein
MIMIYLECHLRAMVSSLGKLWRTPLTSLMTIAVIGVALALPVNFYVLLHNAQNLSQNWNNNSAQISLYLKMNVAPSRVQGLIRQLKDNPQISEVRYVSAQQGLQEFSKVLGNSQVTSMLSKNPLPELIIIDPVPILRNPQGVNAILEIVKVLPEVELAQVDLQWLQRLNNVIVLVKKTILILAFLLVIGVLSIVGNTIRLVAQNESKEIEVMHLVGATNAFIRRPFLYTGIWYGLFGGIIAWFLESLVLMWLRGPVKTLSISYHSDFYLQGLAFNDGLHLLLFGILLGLIGSWIVADRYCKAVQRIGDNL